MNSKLELMETPTTITKIKTSSMREMKSALELQTLCSSATAFVVSHPIGKYITITQDLLRLRPI
ncbi:MAG: hypothetical protein P0S93_04675 [Candidatus Neptunochlamydia sp.]|nr:hypothetical protein [Candidatus Neptunochlamydia sp.]